MGEESRSGVSALETDNRPRTRGENRPRVLLARLNLTDPVARPRDRFGITSYFPFHKARKLRFRPVERKLSRARPRGILPVPVGPLALSPSNGTLSAARTASPGSQWIRDDIPNRYPKKTSSLAPRPNRRPFGYRSVIVLERFLSILRFYAVHLRTVDGHGAERHLPRHFASRIARYTTFRLSTVVYIQFRTIFSVYRGR